MDDVKQNLRRSSILKPQKPRNPFGDIDVRVEEEDVVTVRARRVSFASSNQIKKFTTDEEKLTIWDSTYEESIQGSENSPFFLTFPHSSKSTICNKENVETINNALTVSDDDLDFTPPVGSCTFNVNTLHTTKTKEVPIIEDVSVNLTKAMPSNIKEFAVVTEETDIDFVSFINGNLQDKNVEIENMSVDEMDMSFTQPVTKNVQNDNWKNKNDTGLNITSGDMEFTTAINSLKFDIIQQGDNHQKDLEFTTVIDNCQINDKLENINDASRVDMEFTIPVVHPHIDSIQNNGDNHQKDNLDLNNRSINDAQGNMSSIEMEFTTAINNSHIGIMQSKLGDNHHHDLRNENSHTNILSVDMEFTKIITHSQTGIVENSDCQGQNQIKLSNVDMEFTTAINNFPISMVQTNDNIEDKYEKSKTGYIDNTNMNTSSGDMDFTTATSTENPQDDIVTNDDGNVSHQKDHEELRNRNVRGKDINSTCGGDMEFTMAISNVEVGTIQGNNDDNKDLSSMSFSTDKQGNDYNKTLTGDILRAISNKTSKNNDNFNSQGILKNKGLEITIQDVPSLLPISNDPSLTSTLQFSLGNVTSNEDTQQLINYRLSDKNQTKSEFSQVVAGDLDPSFSKLRHMPLGEYNTNSFHVSLNCVSEPTTSKLQAANISEPTQNNQLEQCDTEHQNKVIALPRETLMEITNDTIKNNSFLCDTQPPENLLEITDSINNTGDFLLSFQHSMSPNWSDVRRMKPNENVMNYCESLLKHMRYSNKVGTKLVKPRETNDLEDLFNKIHDLLVNKVETYGKEPFKAPITSVNSCDSNTGSSDLTSTPNEQTTQIDDVFLNDDAERSIDLKIKDLEECNKKYWQLLSIDNSTYKFTTLFRTILITVQLEETSEKVESVEIEKKIGGGVEPEALYVHKIFCDKLSPKCIKSALGVKYDIRSLLDYIKETMHKHLDYLQEYDQLYDTYGMIMDTNFRIKFPVIKIQLMIVWEFTINMLELDSISDKTVEYYAKVGSINKRDIQRCIQKCPTGTSFIRAFAENIYSLVSCMENNVRHE